MKRIKRIALLALALALALTCAAQAEFIFETPQMDAPEGAGQGMTKEDIRNELGVLDFSRFSCVDNVIETDDGSRHSFRVFVSDEAFSQEIDGVYDKWWFTSGGIMSEMDVDLDGDGVEEYFVYYAEQLPDPYNTLHSTMHCAIYENVGGGYEPAADWVANQYDGGYEAYVHIIPFEKGARILVGETGYGDGASGFTTNKLYRYDGTQVYADVLSYATMFVDGSFFVTDITPEDVWTVWDALDYDGDRSCLASMGVQEGQNLFIFDFGFGHENYLGENSLTRDGVKAVSARLAPYGVMLYVEEEQLGGYYIRTEGGRNVWRSHRDYESGVGSFTELTFVSSLDYTLPGAPNAGTAPAAPEGSAASEGALAFGGTPKPVAPTPQPKATGTVVTTGSVNLRTGPGLGYDKVTAVSTGKTLTYLGETSVDDRGVAWYLVDYKGSEVWISSRYSYLK